MVQKENQNIVVTQTVLGCQNKKNTLVMLVMYHQIEKGRSWWDGREPWEWGVGSDGMRTENSKVV